MKEKPDFKIEFGLPIFLGVSVGRNDRFNCWGA